MVAPMNFPGGVPAGEAPPLQVGAHGIGFGGGDPHILPAAHPRVIQGLVVRKLSDVAIKGAKLCLDL